MYKDKYDREIEEINRELSILRLLKPIKSNNYEILLNSAYNDYLKIYKNKYLEVVARGALEYLYISVS